MLEWLFPVADGIWGGWEAPGKWTPDEGVGVWRWYSLLDPTCSVCFLVHSAIHSNCLILPLLRLECGPPCVHRHDECKPLKQWARTEIPQPRLFPTGMLLQWHKSDMSTFEVSHLFSLWLTTTDCRQLVGQGRWPLVHRTHVRGLVRGYKKSWVLVEFYEKATIWM